MPGQATAADATSRRTTASRTIDPAAARPAAAACGSATTGRATGGRPDPDPDTPAHATPGDSAVRVNATDHAAARLLDAAAGSRESGGAAAGDHATRVAEVRPCSDAASVRAGSECGTCDAAAHLVSTEGMVTELLTCPICIDMVQLPVNLTCFRGCPGTRGQANQTCLRGVLCQHCANKTLQLDVSPGCRFAESGGAARCIICRSTQDTGKDAGPRLPGISFTASMRISILKPPCPCTSPTHALQTCHSCCATETAACITASPPLPITARRG
eukprot:365874-Chlamydomonas_euryale.AAC.14